MSTVSEVDIKDLSPANAKQVAGNHYKQYTIQPWDAIVDWQLGFLDGCAIKYISRWKDKGGVEDIKKAIHFLEKLLETQMDSGMREQQRKMQAAIGTNKVYGVWNEITKEEKNRWGGIP